MGKVPDGSDEMAGLFPGVPERSEEMVSPTGTTVFARLEEIFAEVLVSLRGTLRGLNHHETDGALVDHAIVLEFLPVDMPLMMGDVDAVDLVALGIADITVEGAPTETEGGHEEIIEEPDVTRNNRDAAQPPSPGRNLLKQADNKIRALTFTHTMIGMSNANALSANYSLFLHLFSLF